MFYVLVLHRLHQTALNIARIRGLDSGINETLTTSLCVVEELSRHETIHKAVLDETARLHAVVVSCKVGQSAVLKSILNTAALNQLLTQKCHHLRDVLLTSLRTRVNHLNDTIRLVQRSNHLRVDTCSDLLESRRDVILQLLTIRETHQVLKLTSVNGGQDLCHAITTLLQLLRNEITSGLICNQIGCADRETRVEVVLGND